MTDIGQMQLLVDALAAIQELVPTAIQVDLQTSDQGHYGFSVQEIYLADGSLLSEEGVVFEHVADQAYEFLGLLDWDGVVGENSQGFASIPLEPPPAPPPVPHIAFSADSAVWGCTCPIGRNHGPEGKDDGSAG